MAVFTQSDLMTQIAYTRDRQRALRRYAPFTIVSFTNREAGTIRYLTTPAGDAGAIMRQAHCRIGEAPETIASVKQGGYVIFNRPTAHTDVYTALFGADAVPFAWDSHHNRIRTIGDVESLHREMAAAHPGQGIYAEGYGQ